MEDNWIKMALSSVARMERTIWKRIFVWDFNEAKEKARKKWNKELGQIKVETMDPRQKWPSTPLFTTPASLYFVWSVTAPIRPWSEYSSFEGFTNYTIFSLWDTYRALHPLFNIIQSERNNDMIKSMLVHHDQSVHHMLPIWSHYANENWCMIGHHATSVIADALVKNVGDWQIACVQGLYNTANVSYFDGLGDYIRYHYVPDESHSSVSKTLEYAYNDGVLPRQEIN